PRAPEIVDSSSLPQTQQTQHEKHGEYDQPDFVDRVTAVENETGRDRHGEGGEPAHVTADERFEFQGEMDRENAREHDGQPDRPHIPPEKRLADEENVEVKRPVIICRVVTVEPVLDHLVDEPAVDSFVEMRRLDSEQKKTEERAEAHDQP